MSQTDLVPAAGTELALKVWSTYVENDQLDIQAVRPDIANSWQRCRNLHVDPFHGQVSAIDGIDLEEHIHNARSLLEIARPFMEKLYVYLKGSGCQVILADASGILLDVIGDKEILERTKQIQLCMGGIWSELYRGTNAIGTALAEKKPLQIHGWEHYCQPHHFLTCSASPIFDPDGSITGILDISSDYRVCNVHTLGMVAAAATSIESQLRLQQATEQLATARRYSNILLKNMSDGMISIDNSGIVTDINSRAAEIFSVEASRAKGRHVSQINNAGGAILPILSGLINQESREIRIERAGREICSSASLLRAEDGKVTGALAVLREIPKQSARQAGVAPSRHYTFDDIAAEGPGMAALTEWAKLAAASPFTVMIRGETGTGKEIFAQAIHYGSCRRDKPFIAINCAALPESLVESELFGYEEGSFTGARRGGHPGKFEVATGGTIFLDEIGDMPVSMQTKLLRVIQEGKISRVGSAREIQIDTRIVAATHKDLKLEVEHGTFRSDLYYRLSVLEIKIPPLRERPEDIPALTRQLTQRIALRFNGHPVAIGNDFIARLQTHSWPGNVREMENVIERAMIRSGESGNLTADLLDLPGEAPPISQPKQTSQARIGVDVSLKEAERELIRQTLTAHHGNMRQAAAKLGIGRNTLYRKMKEYGIHRQTEELEFC